MEELHDFGWAVQEAKKGKAVGRKAWETMPEWRDGPFIKVSTLDLPSLDDMLAEDWVLYTEKYIPEMFGFPVHYKK